MIAFEVFVGAPAPAADVTAMTSLGHVTSSVASSTDCARPLSHRLPIVNNALSPVISEIFIVKYGHRHARAHDVHTYQTPPLGTHPSPIYCWRNNSGGERVFAARGKRLCCRPPPPPSGVFRNLTRYISCVHFQKFSNFSIFFTVNISTIFFTSKCAQV